MKKLKDFFLEHIQIDDVLWQQFSQNIRTVHSNIISASFLGINPVTFSRIKKSL